MFLNTRNFFLYLLCVAVLIIAIAVTAVSKQSPRSEVEEYVVPIPAAISNEATLISAVSLDREEKLSAMRKKVAESMVQAPPEESDSPENIPTPEEDNEVTVTVETKVEDRCDSYVPYQGTWQTSGLSFTVVEGARLLQREVGTSSGETVLQLPLRTFPLPVKSCIPSDVIGIALDGSLIRNGEVALYSVFGQETLIGYALDGFPIYGVTAVATDECGGLMAEGHYRYQLRQDTTYILGCFAGTPVVL